MSEDNDMSKSWRTVTILLVCTSAILVIATSFMMY